MRKQLRHLAEAAELPNIAVQILPLEGPKRLALDSFRILQFGKAHKTPLHDDVSIDSLRNNLFVEGETDTYEFRLALEHLAQEVLNPEKFRKLVLHSIRQL